MKLLIVEDNDELASWLAAALRQGRYAVDVASDGEDAWHLLRVSDYDAVILDLGLPNMDGMTVLKRARKAGIQTPIIILTANSGVDWRIAGLDGGADDYLTKPFDVAELEARLRALIRRRNSQTATEIVIGDLSLDTATRQFCLKGEPLALTPREHSVLELLVMKAGTTVSKAALSESVFGFDDTADPSAIEIYVHRVRKKLEGSTVQIATFRGLGYLLRSSAEE
jgi:two-component system response regulator TctD